MANVEISAHLDGRLDLGKALAKYLAAKGKVTTGAPAPAPAPAPASETTAPDTSPAPTEARHRA